jgi:cell division protein FtsI (penicillin-binding protein 3)
MNRQPRQLSLDTTPTPALSSGVDREESRRPAIETGRNRLLVTAAVFAVVFTVLAGRLVHVAMFQGGGEPTLARSTGTVASDGERADIVDRNGELLATNLSTASLYANPKVILDATEAATKLARVLPELDHAAVLTRLQSKRSFVWIKRNLTPKQQYAVNSLGLPGLAFQRERRRLYPHGRLAAHVLGFTGVDNRGLTGVEKYFDSRLSEPRLAAKGPLKLSLDLRVQHALKEELGRAVTTHRAVGAAGVVLDAVNGEVLALVSLPDFDPVEVATAGKEARFNRATLGVYELGSVFKVFTAAMAIDRGTVRLSDGYDASKPIRVARYTIRDTHAKNRWLSVPEIFMYSSNIGAAKMALDVGAEEQRKFMERLGMLRRAELELPEVGLPLYPSRWGDISTMTIGFGHGIAVSTLHVASAFAAAVNGGVMLPTTLLKSELDAVPKGQRVFSPRTSETMRRLLRLVVEHGTGGNAAAEGYLVGGKTGTAEKVGATGYDGDALLSTFVGAFPMTEPRYVVLALLDEPKGTKQTFGFATAGWTAAPVVSRVVSRIAPILGVAPVDETAPDVRRALSIAVKSGKAKLASF